MTSTTALDDARYARMRWNAPLSEQHAELLLHRLDVRGGDTVLDLGCGWGELLLRAMESEQSDTATGIGVDTDPAALDRGRALAVGRGLRDRVRFVTRPASEWTEPADRVICVGSSHTLGGSAPALRALEGFVRPGGRLLFGDGCWERPATPAAGELFAGEVLDLPELIGHALDTGWRVIHLSTADQREWDDFESTWRAGRQEWLLAHPSDERAPEVREQVDEQLERYVRTYRGVLGFCYLVLGR